MFCLHLPKSPTRGDIPGNWRDSRYNRYDSGNRGPEISPEQRRTPDRPAVHLGWITGAGRGNPYGEESPLSCMQFFVRNAGRYTMKVKVRFFARFRELIGNEITAEVAEGTTLPDLVKQVAGKNREGYDAIFDESGRFREFVILMRNARRVDIEDAARQIVTDGDDIAVFPPVAGG